MGGAAWLLSASRWQINAPHLSTKMSKPTRETACTRAEIKHSSANLYSRPPDDAAQNFIIAGLGMPWNGFHNPGFRIDPEGVRSAFPFQIATSDPQLRSRSRRFTQSAPFPGWRLQAVHEGYPPCGLAESIR
jgi:hypothetical protein